MKDYGIGQMLLRNYYNSKYKNKIKHKKKGIKHMRNRKLYIPDSCRKCDRESKCMYPCEDAYNKFKMQNHQNTKNSLRNETYNQPVAMVSEDDTYDKTTLSCGCKKR